jgi:OOP family OmpA-OmpF porin
MRFNKLLFILFLLPAIAPAQSWEFGLTGGGTGYLGDINLNWYPELKETQLGYGAFVRRNFTPNWGLRLNYLGGKIAGDDANFDERLNRGFNFTSRFSEVSLLGEWDAHGRDRYRDDGFHRTFSTFLFAGPGLAFFDPEVDFNDRPDPNPVANDEKIALDRAADLKEPVFTIILGGGLKYDLSKNVFLGLELGIRPTFSDYLDGVSEAGNTEKKDWYMFGGLNLGFRIAADPPDTDKDGVVDKLDNCPDLAGTAALNGCPDRDSDGIADNIDNCPDQAGSTAFRGCPDTDADGIADPDDACPDQAGTAALKGCPDLDLDGITDKEDRCPDQAGTAAFRGCPDTDSDGLADPDDKCPREAGTAANNGCPFVDTDGDGIENKADRCPDKAGPASNQGCPELTREVRQTIDVAVRTIQFENNSSQLKPASLPVLDKVAELLKNYPGYMVTINGHTDAVGSDASNHRLSHARANRCREYLISKGIDASQVEAKGFGEAQPIASNKTAAGRAKNRRVEFVLTEKK